MFLGTIFGRRQHGLIMPYEWLKRKSGINGVLAALRGAIADNAPMP